MRATLVTCALVAGGLLFVAATERDERREERPSLAQIVALDECDPTTLVVVDQGGEPHTFTEVHQFGGGFIPGLNNNEVTVPECAGGFSTVAVARTRILQGSQLLVPGLSKGEHLFQCCIHPWMRARVDVK